MKKLKEQEPAEVSTGEVTATVAVDSFESLGLSASSLAAIRAKGFEVPTRIQAEVIPKLLAGECDIIAQSQTGTGKTAAFGLPLVDKLEPMKGPVQALIMVPTRELAVQVAEEINSLRGSKPLHVVPMYGGQSYELQFRHLRQGVDILVGTPGRLIDHINRGSLDLTKVRWLVLDEADEMLDMGFIEDIETILGTCTSRERMLLFSATMPPRIRSMSKTWMKDTQEVKIQATTLSASLTDQVYMELLERDKFEALCRIVDLAPDFYGMVFCRTKVESDNLYTRLLERGYDSEVLHGDINQAGREKVLDAFRRRLVDILVATDVAARGIDINNLSHVINYSLPSDPESYVHRIGRTGRAGREGTAITFVTPAEFRKLSYIQRESRVDIRRERLPRVEDIIEQKKRRILERMISALEPLADDAAAIEGIYLDMSAVLFAKARELGIPSEELLARLLTVELSDDLDASRYKAVTDLDRPKEFAQRDSRGRESRDFRDRPDRGDIREVREPREPRSNLQSPSEENADTVRVYIGKGKADGFTKPQLVSFVRDASGVRDRYIDQVEVREFFSFITVSRRDASRIIETLNSANKTGAKPMARLADAEESTSSRAPRGDRPSRGDYPPRGDRPPRGDYQPRGDRPPRGDYQPRGDRPPRGDYPPRGDRPPRSEHTPRGDYVPRGDRPDRADRPARTDRPDANPGRFPSDRTPGGRADRKRGGASGGPGGFSGRDRKPGGLRPR